MSDKNLLGIDEAGRGCVIGPLVIAGVLIEKDKLSALADMGVKDSKRLTRCQREELLPAIEEIAARVYSVAIPSSALTENLNALELEAMAKIINELKPDEAYIDAPVSPRALGNWLLAIGQKLKAKSQKPKVLICENGADAKYPIVSAASIAAKVRRDKEIEALRRKYGDFGWGYPSESKTRKFLKSYLRKHGDFPDCVRLKWKTVLKLTKV